VSSAVKNSYAFILALAGIWKNFCFNRKIMNLLALKGRVAEAVPKLQFLEQLP
jgi:hypothetical protein